MQYLGVPISSTRLRSIDCNRFFVTELWQVRRVGITNFFLMPWSATTDTVQRINKTLSAFLWKGSELGRGGAKVSWVDICRLKQMGGLGIQDLKNRPSTTMDTKPEWDVRMFSVTSAFSSCNSSPPKVPWHHILWGPSHVLRFSFIAWLTIKGRLSTKTLLRSRELRTGVGCVLCSDGVADVLDHLYFSCHFSQGVWILLLDRCGLTRNLVNWRDVVTWMARKTKGKARDTSEHLGMVGMREMDTSEHLGDSNGTSRSDNPG
ncbi:hypothetical protein CJ030_MR2G005728 [Morella rubra]|uniref:Reverse transcriptase zinc-binding domain-containing protein n=1 Tax=Morella rubra TaxID=262757 RepID=A0A6A1WG05_9ROSI|nr:hypothetical protein CJ030_MR2G005728 [Morella rubra]